MIIQVHVINPGVGLHDIVPNGQNPDEWKNFYVDLAKGDPISEQYTY